MTEGFADVKKISSGKKTTGESFLSGASIYMTTLA
jgi:hypothetical protein